MKTCTKCLIEKPVGDFGKSSGTKDGLNHRCKPCHNGAFRDWASANPEKARQAVANWRNSRSEEQKERDREGQRRDHQKHRDERLVKQRNSRYKRRYGITAEQYDNMVEERNGLCDICGEKPKGKTERASILHVDHCHETGVVRGLLCSSCNVCLGVLEKCDWRERAELYLEKYKVS